MQDFACSEPDKMNYSILAERVRFFKEDKKGAASMSRIMDELREETIQERNKEVARRMLAAGKLSLEDISEYSGLSLDEVKQLQSGKTA